MKVKSAYNAHCLPTLKLSAPAGFQQILISIPHYRNAGDRLWIIRHQVPAAPNSRMSKLNDSIQRIYILVLQEFYTLILPVRFIFISKSRT